MKRFIALAAIFCALNVAFVSLGSVVRVSHAQENPDPPPKPDPEPKPEALGR